MVECNTCKIPLRPWSQEELELAKKLYESGKVPADIADELYGQGYERRTIQSVRNKLYSEGIRSEYHPTEYGIKWKPEEDDILRKCIEENDSVGTMRDMLRDIGAVRSDCVVRNRLAKLGLSLS